MKLELHSQYKPTGDQPTAIARLLENLKKKEEEQILLGVTGSGKTFTMANVIEKTQRPTLIICHNKTLAAQLSTELTEFFPNNAVCYFVSYYDYYLPESYIPSSDTYLEKETDINEEVERLRHFATESLMTRDDVVIVSSVSCIYGLGSPSSYLGQSIEIKKGQKMDRRDIINKLIGIYYTRNDYEINPGTFSIKGDSIEIRKSSTNERIIIDMWGDKIEQIVSSGLFSDKEQEKESVKIFPARHYVTEKDDITRIIPEVQADLKKQLAKFTSQNKLVEAQRLKQRVNYDLEMMQETGYVSGIENYSRYLTNRDPGEPPEVLIDFFRLRFPNFLTIIDESHMTIPQIRGMYAGDQSRKQNLIDYGFRLPSALDNRPLRFDEFLRSRNQVIYSSATPGIYEFNQIVNRKGLNTEQKELDIVKLREQGKLLSEKLRLKNLALGTDLVAQQLIRPTGLLDPEIIIKPVKGQIEDLITEVKSRVAKKQRVLVTTITKKNSEALAKFLDERNIKAYYLHADVDNMERLEILRDLRLGVYDVVVGINLLREGLDLPEVSLVAILEADKEGFLRNETSLIQTIGRAARHEEGQVIMYADKETPSMREAIRETNRRRKIQREFNQKHGIKPTGIKKEIGKGRLSGAKKEKPSGDRIIEMGLKKYGVNRSFDAADEVTLANLESKMELAARNLEFEKAAELRDLIMAMKDQSKKNKTTK